MRRRELLISTVAAAAGILLSDHSTLASTRPRRWLYVDGQAGFGGLDEVDGKLKPSDLLARAIRARDLDIGSFTIGPVGNVPEAFTKTVEDIATINGLVDAHPDLFFRLASADAVADAGKGRLGVIYNLQDTVALEGSLDRVAALKALGIGIIQLTYNKRNLAGDGCLESANAGLSDFGRSVIEKIEEERILLDLSHAGQRTVAEGIAHSKAAPVISHTGCRDLVDFPRNTFDAELRALANKGGVAGIYMMPFLRKSGQPGREDLLRHLTHAVNVCGEDHVSIGTDNPLLPYAIDDAARKTQREFYETRARAGIAAPGEAPDVFNLVEGYNRSDRFDALAADLRGLGWRDARIEKVLGLNFLSVLDRAWR